MTDRVWVADRHVFQMKDGVNVFLFPKGAEVPWAVAVRLGLVEDKPAPAAKKVAEEAAEDKAVKAPTGKGKPTGVQTKKG